LDYGKGPATRRQTALCRWHDLVPIRDRLIPRYKGKPTIEGLGRRAVGGGRLFAGDGANRAQC